MKPQALVVMILFSLTPLATTQIPILQEEVNISQSSDNTIVQQFGTGFDETVIASTNDGLNVPRDLEFHPSSARNDELWPMCAAEVSASRRPRSAPRARISPPARLDVRV